MVKVSIIISVYNAENYLKQCLESAVNQTLEDIEIICVNDGSSDNSLEVLNDIAAKDERIKVISQENAGQGAALNTALDNVHGEYVLNIDCDDWIELDACEFLYNKSREMDLDLMFYCAVVYNEHDGEYFAKPYYNFPKFDSSLENKVFTFEDIDYYFNICVTNWTKVYRAVFLKEYDFKFKDCYFQDNIFHWVVLLNAKRISFSSRQFYYHRVRDGQISFNYNENYFVHIVMSDYIVEVFKKNNRFEEYKDKVINWKIAQVRSPYFNFDEPLRRRYWEMARENLLNFKEEFDIEALDYYVKLFYVNMTQSNTFEEFEISIKANKLENENTNLKNEINGLCNENKKLKNKNNKLKNKNIKLTDENKKLKNKNKKLKKDNAELKEKNKRIKKSYADIKNSKSWKLTKPIRTIKNRISK